MKKHYFPTHIIAQLQEEFKADTGKELDLHYHCKRCGDCNPKFGYYPLIGIAIGFGVNQTVSVLVCNKCSYSDEEYFQRFGELKSKDI